eukprot:jgi/Botrbrau1/19608/Bobra.0035s0085.1
MSESGCQRLCAHVGRLNLEEVTRLCCATSLARQRGSCGAFSKSRRRILPG